MGKLSTKTTARLELLRRMNDEGLSTRAMGAVLGVSQTVAMRWLQEMGRTSTVAPGRRPKVVNEEEVLSRYRDELGKIEAEENRERSELAEKRRALSPYEQAKARLEVVRERMDREFDAYVAGSIQQPVWRGLREMEESLLLLVQRLAPTDEKNDPAKIAAARDAEAKFDEQIEQTILAADRESRCVHCGGHPFDRELTKDVLTRRKKG